ncbi:hypothetical protein SAMN05661093_07499 [Kibdelosporangium aridum]|uniref:Uncharacterized protein n=2 Tax=Kibdelosporangium aridum TaxID=2030 RepID=A0A1W2FL02_KIBAR|nr:hypothetical protein SAMN05661093_07499 [Kibdelosporangium aridum]
MWTSHGWPAALAGTTLVAMTDDLLDCVPPLAVGVPVVGVVMTFATAVYHGPRQLWDFTCNPPLIWIGSSAEGAGQTVVTWAAGDDADELLAMPEQMRFDRALASVRTITGNCGAMYTAAETRMWTDR